MGTNPLQAAVDEARRFDAGNVNYRTEAHEHVRRLLGVIEELEAASHRMRRDLAAAQSKLKDLEQPSEKAQAKREKPMMEPPPSAKKARKGKR